MRANFIFELTGVPSGLTAIGDWVLLFFQRIWFPFLLAFLIFLLTPFFNRTQQGWEDWLMRRHVRGQFFAPIKIVYFDENDLASLGGWPLSRNVYAFVAQRLCQLGVQAVGFDVYWGPRPSAPDENDLALAAVLAQNENLCGSFYFEDLGVSGADTSRVAPLEWPAPIANGNVITAAGLHVPATELLHGPARYGFANLIADDNGVLRAAPLFVRNRAAIFPSFSRVLAHRFARPLRDSSVTQIKINYQVEVQHLPLVPLRGILSAEFDSARAAELRGSIVLVGIISTQLGFARPTPIAPEMPIVAVHAQVLDNLLSQSSLRPFPQWLWLITLALLAALFAVLRGASLKRLLLVSFVLALFGVCLAVLLWRMNLVFPNNAYLFSLLLLALPGLLARARRQQQTLAMETANRAALEKEFREAVQAATRAQAETAKTRQRFQQEIARLRRELTTISPAQQTAQMATEFPEIVHGLESPMAKVLSELARIAATEAPVLITGESGTGKELVAHAIHQKSARACAVRRCELRRAA